MIFEGIHYDDAQIGDIVMFLPTFDESDKQYYVVDTPNLGDMVVIVEIRAFTVQELPNGTYRVASIEKVSDDTISVEPWKVMAI